MKKRNGVYYFRKKVPLKLRCIIKRHEYVYSLKTKNPVKAAVLVKLYEDSINSIFKKALIKMDFKNIKQFTAKSKFDSNGNLIELEKTVDPKEICLLRDHGFSTEDIVKIMNLGVLNDVSETVKPKALSAAGSDISLEKSLQGVVDAFYEKETVESGESISSEKSSKVRRLVEILGGEKSIKDIVITDAGYVRDTLLKLPKNSNKFRGYKVFDVIKSIELEEIQTSQCIRRFSAKHVNDHLALYKAIFKFALTSGWLQRNVFDGVMTGKRGAPGVQEKIRRKGAGKLPFSKDELIKIFSTPLFTDFASSKFDENFKYWIPLLGLFTGARIAQIASLDCDDIIKKDGVWVIDFNVNNDMKTAKNIASTRSVPIHSTLLNLGILEFTREIKNKGFSRLFPELASWSKKDGYSRRAGDWFKNRYLLENLGFSEDKNQSFHSYRSTLLSYLRDAGLDEYQRNTIIGWNLNEDKENTVVRNHYTHIEIASLKIAIERVTFPNELALVKPFVASKAIFGSRPGRNEYSK